MSSTYLGNPQLKKAGVKITFTNDQVIEYVRCADDPCYFIENYIRIVNVDRGLVPFDLYSYQKELIESFENHRFTIAKLPRQAGKSVTVVSYFLWVVLFQDNQNIAILANKGALARDLLAKVKLAYEHLPMWLQQGVVTWNKGNIELENGSKILASSTTSSAVRGGSYNCVFLDEFAFVQPNMATEFFASVYPVISSGQTTKLLIVSTPNGLNHYYKMWMDAVNKKSLYHPIEVHWSLVPGRDEKWKEETIRNTSQEQFDQEHGCEFLGSSHTLISAAKLRTLVFIDPVNRTNMGVEVYTLPVGMRKVFDTKLDKDVIVPARVYALVADVSHGVGIDYSAFSVIDVTEKPFRQVAKFRNNEIVPSAYPDVIAKTAAYYNNAYILCESNDVGMQVLINLQMDLEVENILGSVVSPKGQKLSGGHTKQHRLGVKTTTAIKRIGCAALKDLIELDQLIVHDYETVSELTTFIRHLQSFQAEEGCHDDLVMGLVLFGWLSTQEQFKSLTNINIRAEMAASRLSQLADDMTPAPILDDGQTPIPDPLDQTLGYLDYSVTRW